ncbi:MAG: hypothetical protein AAFY34_00320 [Pseudomonadota bacterium]
MDEVYILAAIAIGVAVFAAAASAAWYFFLRAERPKQFRIRADMDGTYLYRKNPNDAWTALQSGELVEETPPTEILVRPVGNRRFLAFTSYDEELDKNGKQDADQVSRNDHLSYLMSENSDAEELYKKRSNRKADESPPKDPPGRVSLRIQVCKPIPFHVRTKDRHRLLIKAKLRFQLTRDGVVKAARFDDFATVLDDRIEAELRSAIGARRDEELRGDQGEIAAAVEECLKKNETGPDTNGSALGIKIIGFYFNFEEAPRSISATVKSKDAADGAIGLDLIGSSFTGQGSVGPMHFSEQDLDRIADVFKGRDKEETAALVRLMELQTQQNIVQTVSQSGRLVVVTAKELGINAELLKQAKGNGGE